MSHDLTTAIPCSDQSETHAVDATGDLSMGLSTAVAESTRLSLPGLVNDNTLQSLEQDRQIYEADGDSSSDDDSSSSDDESSSSDDSSSSDELSPGDYASSSSENSSHASLMRSGSFQQPDPMNK